VPQCGITHGSLHHNRCTVSTPTFVQVLTQLDMIDNILRLNQRLESFGVVVRVATYRLILFVFFRH